MKILVFSFIVLLQSFAQAANTKKSSSISGTILKTIIEPNNQNGDGLLTIVDRAGHNYDFPVGNLTQITRDGKSSSFDQALIGDQVINAKYNPKTKKLSVLELKSSTNSKPANQARASIEGEVAMTDVIEGKISVRLGGGGTLGFKVSEATQILRSVDGKTPETALFESLKVGQRVDIYTKDWKLADKIQVYVKSQQ